MNRIVVGRIRGQKNRVEAGLAGFADGAYRFTRNGAEHHHFATGRFHLGNLRRKIGGTALVGCLLGVVHADGLQARLATAHHFQSELVVLVQGADFLDSFFFHQFGCCLADLIEVGDREGIFELVQRFVHFTRRGQGKEIDDILLELNRHRRQIVRGPDVADHHENLVLIDQFLRPQEGLLGVVARVLDDDLELAAVDAALLIDFVDPQHHAQSGLLAQADSRTRQVLD